MRNGDHGTSSVSSVIVSRASSAMLHTLTEFGSIFQDLKRKKFNLKFDSKDIDFQNEATLGLEILAKFRSIFSEHGLMAWFFVLPCRCQASSRRKKRQKIRVSTRFQTGLLGFFPHASLQFTWRENVWMLFVPCVIFFRQCSRWIRHHRRLFPRLDCRGLGPWAKSNFSARKACFFSGFFRPRNSKNSRFHSVSIWRIFFLSLWFTFLWGNSVKEKKINGFFGFFFVKNKRARFFCKACPVNSAKWASVSWHFFLLVNKIAQSKLKKRLKIRSQNSKSKEIENPAQFKMEEKESVKMTNRSLNFLKTRQMFEKLKILKVRIKI